VGYDLHITRAFIPSDSERCPILDHEVADLVRDEPDLVIPADAPRRPGFGYLNWDSPDSDGEDWLRFENGELRTTNPRPVFVRRMTELAATLDAWLIGDDAEVYERDGDAVVVRQRDPGSFAWNARFIAPVTAGDWTALAAAQRDFTTMTRIEAVLPSGVRWIPCPPVACWTRHPSGKPVPFFHARDAIEVRHVDDPILRRMAALAAALHAEVVGDR
jgi:hypothetical protein